MRPAALGPLSACSMRITRIDDVRKAVVELTIAGPDNYRLEGRSSMNEISRDPLDLVRQAMSQHQYPDGFALFLGTMFAPVQDRDTSRPGIHAQTGRHGAGFHPASGRAGKQGHQLQRGAAMEFRHLRFDATIWRVAGC